MADPFVELTRIDVEPRGTPVLVNLGQVAWIEAHASEASRIVFAINLPSERGDADPRSIVVRESVAEIASLTGLVQKTDREAIVQAWVDQRARRGMSRPEGQGSDVEP